MSRCPYGYVIAKHLGGKGKIIILQDVATQVPVERLQESKTLGS